MLDLLVSDPKFPRPPLIWSTREGSVRLAFSSKRCRRYEYINPLVYSQLTSALHRDLHVAQLATPFPWCLYDIQLRKYRYSWQIGRLLIPPNCAKKQISSV